MIVPVTIGAEGQFVNRQAYDEAVTSAGILARLQVSTAELLAQSSWFIGDGIPIVVESVGDYVSEMNQFIASSTGLFALVSTPDFRYEAANTWVASLKIQAFEFPAVNRSRAGRYITAQKLCEIMLGMLKDRQPSDEWAPIRPRSIEAVQRAETGVANYAFTGITRTQLTTK